MTIPRWLLREPGRRVVLPPLAARVSAAGVDLEVAKQFLAQVHAMLDAQTKAIDNLRARVMDVARLSATLAAAAAAAAVTASGAPAKPALATAAVVAALVWLVAGWVCLAAYKPVSWGFPGWKPQEWIAAPDELAGEPVPILVALAVNRDADTEANQRIMAEVGNRLVRAVWLMVAAPAFGLAAGLLVAMA